MAQGAGRLRPIRIGISSCLLGERVRYDGGHKLDRYLAGTLGQYVDWDPVCPEAEAGLGTPREAMCLLGGSESEPPRLVTRDTGINHTATMQKWTRQRLKQLAGKKPEDGQLCGFVFKSRSPSCSITGGIFARTFMDAFPQVPVEDEGRLRDSDRRENFIERVFVMGRWLELTHMRASLGRLISFHSDHKYLVMAHSPAHMRQLERLVAEGREKGAAQSYAEYMPLLMEGLRLRATVRKNVNVLSHMLGYLGKFLHTGEHQELREAIDEYHRGLAPLIVPLTLLKHYAHKYDEPFLARQHYLNPAPAELMLRNRV